MLNKKPRLNHALEADKQDIPSVAYTIISERFKLTKLDKAPQIICYL
jgi:hypothetical protein